jgi:vacuolar protein-sorting-associated protein 4
MQGVGKESNGLLILGATNVPWELDPAVRRRFEKRVYIPLPEKEARKKMFKLNLGTTPNSLTDEDYDNLGELTENYSGSDISTVVKDALMEPIRKCQSAKKFRVEADGSYVPTYPSDPSGIECTLQILPDPSKLKAPVICVVRYCTRV